MKILYVDMDNVLVDFKSGIDRTNSQLLNTFKGRLDEVPGIFSKMDPMPGALDGVKILSEYFNIYILSTAPWENPSAWSDKLNWIKKYIPKIGYKKLILSHNKHLNKGDFLIDDRTKNGAKDFEGEFIQFGTEAFPDWTALTSYLMNKK